MTCEKVDLRHVCHVSISDIVLSRNSNRIFGYNQMGKKIVRVFNHKVDSTSTPRCMLEQNCRIFQKNNFPKKKKSKALLTFRPFLQHCTSKTRNPGLVYPLICHHYVAHTHVWTNAAQWWENWSISFWCFRKLLIWRMVVCMACMQEINKQPFVISMTFWAPPHAQRI